MPCRDLQSEVPGTIRYLRRNVAFLRKNRHRCELTGCRSRRHGSHIDSDQKNDCKNYGAKYNCRIAIFNRNVMSTERSAFCCFHDIALQKKSWLTVDFSEWHGQFR